MRTKYRRCKIKRIWHNKENKRPHEKDGQESCLVDFNNLLWNEETLDIMGWELFWMLGGREKRETIIVLPTSLKYQTGNSTFKINSNQEKKKMTHLS